MEIYIHNFASHLRSLTRKQTPSQSGLLGNRKRHEQFIYLLFDIGIDNVWTFYVDWSVMQLFAMHNSTDFHPEIIELCDLFHSHIEALNSANVSTHRNAIFYWICSVVHFDRLFFFHLKDDFIINESVAYKCDDFILCSLPKSKQFCGRHLTFYQHSNQTDNQSTLHISWWI